MKRNLLLGIVGIMLLCSHDLYLKLDNYYFEPNSQATIQLFNGSFDVSENVIDRNRMIDASLVGNGKREAIDSTQWQDKDNITFLNLTTGKAGTWLAGVSTASRKIEMDAVKFNTYLEKDGVIDMLELRKAENEINQDAVEKYAKHVKTIFQVGDKTSEDWNTVLDYPIEFVPLQNPYESHAGHDISIQLLFEGKPLANHLVGIGTKSTHSHDDNASHSHDDKTANEAEHDHTHANDNSESHTHSHSHDDKTVNEAEHDHPHANDNSESHTHSHSHDDANENHTHDPSKTVEKTEGHTHEELIEMRTNSEGVLTFNLTTEGIWFLKTIHMKKSEEAGFTHESNWATLSFQIAASDHSHDDDSNEAQSHEHGEEDHDHEENNYFAYIFWIASIVIVGVLFFIFKKKK